MNADKPILTPILTAPMWFYVVVACCLIWIAIFVSIALTPGPQWTVVEYESRGPNRYSRVLLDQRTGRTCEVVRTDMPTLLKQPSAALTYEEDSGIWPSGGGELADAFWVCNNRPQEDGVASRTFLRE